MKTGIVMTSIFERITFLLLCHCCILWVFVVPYMYFWCDFDRASSLICGNKMPTRCNRGFYWRSYCLLNMFRTPLCPSSRAQEYYTVVAACCISCCGFQVSGLVWSWGLCVRFAGCCNFLQTRHITGILLDDDLLSSKHVGVILCIFMCFNTEISILD